MGARTENIVITSYLDVNALAASERLLFVAARDGIAVYDRQMREWLPPLTASSGYPGGDVTVMAADPVEDAVWIALRGTLVYYRPATDMLTSMVLPGGADAIVFDRRAPSRGALVHGAGGWMVASRSGFLTPAMSSDLPPPGSRIVPPELAEVVQRYPSIRSFAALLTRDASMRSWPITAGTMAPEGSDVWLGTAGGGVFEVDPTFNRSSELPFGLLGPRAAALDSGAGGVWVAGGWTSTSLAPRGGARAGLTVVSPDLQRWTWLEASPAYASLLDGATDLDVDGNTVWVATRGGLLVLDATHPTAIQLLRAGSGLPTDRVTSVRAVPGGAWVATADGVALVQSPQDSARAHAGAQRMLEVTGIVARSLGTNDMTIAGDSLWLAADQGLFVLSPLSVDATPRRLSSDPRLAHAMRALARADSIVVAAAEEELIALDARTLARIAPLDGVSLVAVRGARAMAADDRTVWVAGPGGVAVVQRSTGAVRFLTADRDIPADPADVLLEHDVAWIATRDGLVRLERLPDGGVR